MYESYFGFRHAPFSLTPDPRFLYLSGHHREALAHLLYGVGEGGGFVQLTGEVGTGKTTLCRSVLEQAPAHVDLALVLNPRVTPHELVATVCDELGASYPADTASIKTLVDVLTRRLLEGHSEGRRAVVVIDEAQNLDAAALEQIRLLTNLETPTQKLLQIVLIGQPELQQLMALPQLRQLAQRITARYHLPPLSKGETFAYVRHRLRVAGGSPDLFTPAALRLLHRASRGVPRLINILCDRALLGGYARERRRVNSALVRRAVREVRGEQPRPARSRHAVWWRWTAVTALLIVAVIAVYRGDLRHPFRPVASQNAAAVAEPVAPPAVTTSAIASPPEEDVPVPIAVPPEIDSDALLQMVSESVGSGTPLRGLLRLWGVETAAGDDPCAAAAAAGLLCYQGEGNWTEVLYLDRPVVLDLQVRRGVTLPVLITGAEADHVYWQRDGETVRLPRQAVEALWHGAFTLVWRPPPGGGTLLRNGSEGREVEWLASRLAALEGQPDPEISRFDAALEEQVRTVQERFGLAPDGIAGRETIMHLNSATAPDIPRLQSAVE